MNYQFSSTNQRLNDAYLLRAELRFLQAGDQKLFRQIILTMQYRWNEILAGKNEKLPR